MPFPPRSMLIVFLVLPMSLAIAVQETGGQTSELVEARARLLEAFQIVQSLDFQGVSSSETGKLVEQLNNALANLRRANETGSDSYTTLSADISSQVLAEAQIIEAAAERQTVLTQLTAYSVAIISGALSSLVLVDIDMLRRIVPRMKVVEKQSG